MTDKPFHERLYDKINSPWYRGDRGVFDHSIWSMPEVYHLQDMEWYCYEKIDGTNIRVIWDGERVRFGGKTLNAQIPIKLLDMLAEEFPASRFKDFDRLILFGEGFGGNIQKAGAAYGELQFRAFDAMIGDRYLNRSSFGDVMERLSLLGPSVELVGTLAEAETFCREGFDSELGGRAEGLVIRPPTDLYTQSGERIITKLKTKDFRDR